MNRDNDEIRALRLSYERGELNREDITDNPFDLFKIWFDEAVNADVLESNAIQLASIGAQGNPRIRTVLLKEILEEGYVFYTNYKSNKGTEIKLNNQVSFIIFWKELERQVRVEGIAEKLPESQSTAYYHSRPKGSQIGAWVSPQSQIIDNRSVLDDEAASLQRQYADEAQLPKPPHWGGYIIKPNYFEFWQGRKNRLHDRYEYQKADSRWHINRLAP